MRLGTAIEHLVEAYKYASDKEWIQDKVAWALYHTWKDADDRKTEPQTDWETEKRDNSLCYKCVKECDRRVLNRYTIECNQYEPKDEPQTDTEIAKAIVHKMIDDAVIAEDAYPDLRQKMHDAVDEYEPQTCEECEHWNDTEDGCADRHGCKTEPTISKMEQVDKDINVRSKESE